MIIGNHSRAMRRLGLCTAVAIVSVTGLYAITLVIGLVSLASPTAPIRDPWLSALELEIIVLAPLMVVLMAVVHVEAPPTHKVFSLLAVIFTSLLAGLTCTVHFVILMVGQQLPEVLTFRWPSVPYAVDIVAWDVFFGLSMLFAAPVFVEGRLCRSIRVLMSVSGILALFGMVAVVVGEMPLRMIGVAGYVVVYPVAVALLAVRFRRPGSELSSLPT